MYKKAYLTEKKSQVLALAEALDLDIDPKNQGLAFSKDKTIVVVQLQGHVIIGLEPQEYSEEWGKFGEQSLYIFPDEFKMKVNPAVENIFLVAKKYLLESENIFLATDSDCEGAAIALNVIKMLNLESRVQGMIPMGSTHVLELRKAINDYKSIPYKALAASGSARANLDWVEGMSYSRAGSYYLGNKNKVKLPYGGVMTPTVALVVNRELENVNHTIRYYYTVTGYLRKGDNLFEFSLERKYINDKDKESFTTEFETEEQAKEAIANFKDREIKVDSLTRKESKTTPPQLYELGQLQIDMYNSTKCTPTNTMDIGQKLYDSPVSINTYVRTDSVYLKETEFVDVPHILNLLKDNNIIDNKIISNILSKELIKRTGEKGVFYNPGVIAHGAIVPVLNQDLPKWLKTLNNLEKYYYMLVAKRYTANFMPDYVYIKIKGITEEINDCRMVFTESIPVSAGWKELYEKNILNEIADYKPSIPSDLKSGDYVTLDSFKSNPKETKPRPYFTLATLLSAMMKVANLYPDNKEIKTFLGENGIGTNATREKIINKLLLPDPKTGDTWLYIDDKEKVRPTKKAMDYIEVLPEELTSPIKRALLSKELKDIEFGRKDKDVVINEYREIVKNNIEIFKNIYLEKGPIAAMGGEKSLGNCPACSKNVIENNNWYVCTGAEYNHETKQNTGCEFKVYKHCLESLNKKEITRKEMEDILAGKNVTFNLKNDKGEFSPNIIATPKGIEFRFATFTEPGVDLGACPNCGAGVYEKEKIFLCSGADIYKDEDGSYKNRGCDYKIIKSSLTKFGKEKITADEVSELLKNKKVKFKLKGPKGPYECEAIIDNQWGLKLNFDSVQNSAGEPLGKCPSCNSGNISEKPALYSCSNGQSKKLPDGTYENTGCQYKIYKGALSKFGKDKISPTDVKKLLDKGSFQASLTKQKTNEKYTAKIIPDMTYGIKIDGFKN